MSDHQEVTLMEQKKTNAEKQKAERALAWSPGLCLHRQSHRTV